MAATAAKQAYTRADACRLLKITERQLKGWEKQELIAPRETYGFPDLIAVRALEQLRRQRVAPAKVRLALAALTRKLRHIHDPLAQLKLYVEGKKIRVDVEGRSMDAVSGQLLLDFDRGELNRLLEFRPKPKESEERTRRLSAERWFQKGLDLEQTGAPVEQVIEAYKKALELDPKSAGALVNLGTIYFNGRSWKQAERYYLQALEADPGYALAHFDLANLYDERGDREKALKHYQEALVLAPNYADAHYNLALLYQSLNQPMKAVRHWTVYLKLDPAGHWAAIARRELDKLRRAAVVPGSGSRG